MLKKLFIIMGLGLFSFATFAAKTTYSIDTQASKLGWLGKKIGGEHSGSIKVSKGSLIIDGRELIGGSFEIDMRSIKTLDIKNPAYNKKLTKHLNGEDFFGTKEFPTAKLKIKNAIFGKGGIWNIQADLTIKGITRVVLFDAELKVKGKKAEATGKIIFDRTHFGIKYKSKNFFKKLGDKVIHDKVELTVKLVAKK